MSELQGGKFGHGFASAAVTQLLSPVISTVNSNDTDFNAGRVAVAALVGGTTSALTGGKFANGALTGAFSRAFNDELSHWDKMDKKNRAAWYKRAAPMGFDELIGKYPEIDRRMSELYADSDGWFVNEEKGMYVFENAKSSAVLMIDMPSAVAGANGVKGGSLPAIGNVSIPAGFELKMVFHTHPYSQCQLICIRGFEAMEGPSPKDAFNSFKLAPDAYHVIRDGKSNVFYGAKAGFANFLPPAFDPYR